MAITSMPDNIPPLVNAAFAAIHTDEIAYETIAGAPARHTAAQELIERWGLMQQETESRPMLLDAEKDVSALYSIIAGWRLVVLARGLHILNEYLRGAVDIPGAPKGKWLENATQLIREASSNDLKLSFLGSSIVQDKAAEHLIRHTLTAWGWRGTWKVKLSAKTEGDSTVVTAKLFWATDDVTPLLTTQERFEKNVFAVYPINQFDTSTHTGLIQLCTQASLEENLRKCAANYRADAERLTLQAAEKIEIARRYDAAANTTITANSKNVAG